MRRKKSSGKFLGIGMILLGSLILFARVLPPGFWWFCIGTGLIIGGACLLSRK